MDKEPLFEIQIPQEINFNLSKNDEELQALARVIRRNKAGFLLLFVECNLINLSIDLNNKLQKKLGDNIKDIFIDNDNVNIFSILSRYENSSIPISIIGLDELLPSDNPISFLGQLNHNRGWFKKLDCPLILWLPEYAIRLIAEHAPDFWAWRSGTYSFHGSYQHISEAYEQTSISQRDSSYKYNPQVNTPTKTTENRLRTMRNILEELLFTAEGKIEKAKLLNSLGDIAVDLHNWKDAINYYQKTLEMWQELNESTKLISLTEKMTKAYIDANDFNGAVEFVQKSNNSKLKSIGFQTIASILADKNDQNQAQTYYLKALEIEEKVSNEANIAYILRHLGMISLDQNNFSESLDYLQRALATSQKLTNRREEGVILVIMGNVYMRIGKTTQAIDYFDKGLKISHEIGWKRGEQIALGNLGNALRMSGNTFDAIKYFERALVICRDLGDRRAEGDILINLGNLFRDVGNFRDALNFYEQALEIQRENDIENNKGYILRNLGLAYAEVGDSRRAISYLEQSLTISREMSDKQSEMRILGTLGTVYARTSDFKRAIKYLEQQVAMSKDLKDLQMSATGLANLSVTHAQQGEFDQALQLAREAEDIFSRIGDVESGNQVKGLISQLEKREQQINPDVVKSAFEAFLHSSSLLDMRSAVSKYPILADDNFIRTIEEYIQTQISNNIRNEAENRLDWLRRIAKSRK